MDYNSRLRQAAREVLEGRSSDLRETARRYNVPVSALKGIATFYLGREENQVCMGLPCVLKGARRAAEELERRGVKFSTAYCLGYCDKGPVVKIGGRLYTYRGSLQEIPGREEALRAYKRLDAYVKEGGYSAALRLLEERDRSFVLSLLDRANLRGLGGAGFPTAAKWRSLLSNPDRPKYLVVNFHEGEPGTFKDRELVESNPHKLLEGTLIASLVLGVDEAIIAVREDYEAARAVLEAALEELKAFLASRGAAVPPISVVSVGGSYVVGEETALLEALEGRRGEPRVRPPYPTERGLYGKPTVVNNVETIAVLVDILRAYYEGREPAVEKRYSVTGDVERPGVYVLKMGARLGELLKASGASDVKAVFIGGVSGGLLPGDADIALDFDGARKAGVGLGTGSVIVLSSGRCIVDAMYEVAQFFAAESCGKCEPCRLGTRELVEVVRRIKAGRATEEDLKWAESVAKTMMETSLCGLGQAAGKVFLDALGRFREEFEEHLRGVCRAGVCFR